MNKTRHGWLGVALRGVLSLFIVFHLSVLLLVPNGDYLLGSWSERWIQPYVQFMEFTNRWSFFAPEPGQPIFIEWELLNAQGETVETGSFPDQKSPFLIRERQNRRVAAVEFMIPQEARVEKVMVPYLCGKYPKAYSAKLWRVAYQVPPREEVVKGTRKIGDDVNLTKRLVSHNFCENRL